MSRIGKRSILPLHEINRTNAFTKSNKEPEENNDKLLITEQK
jgi:hypothetical protein